MELIRKALTTEHRTRHPVASGHIEKSGGWSHHIADHVQFTLRGPDHRYVLHLNPSEAAQVAAWCARILTEKPDKAETPAAALRLLADAFDRGEFKP